MKTFQHYCRAFENKKVAYLMEDGKNLSPSFPFHFQLIRLNGNEDLLLHELIDEHDVYILSKELLNRTDFRSFFNKIIDLKKLLYISYDEKSLTPLVTHTLGSLFFKKQRIKRIADLLFASIILLLVSPLMILVAIAIKIESKGSVFFARDRAANLYSKPFKMYKFRTMIKDADGLKYNQFGSNSLLFKLEDDPRVTKVGCLLRKYSIDELPQIINVIKGDMSLVGPRPLPVKDFEMYRKYHNDYWLRLRSLVKPGMTGLWQISRRNNIDHFDMICYDYQYIDNMSIALDLSIVLRTLKIVLKGIPTSR